MNLRRPRSSSFHAVLLWTTAIVSLIGTGSAFVVNLHDVTTVGHRPFACRRTRLFATSLPDIDSMKARDMRKELESYGISTKSFFEKKEFASALEKARAEGKKPVDKKKEPSAASAKTASSSTSTKSSSTSSSSKKSRDERLKEEKEKAKKMKTSELKKELKDLGISTKSFFEKSEFVRAVAEARVDGVKKQARGAARAPQDEDEPFDPSYRDVAMQKYSPDPLRMGPVIDIQLAR